MGDPPRRALIETMFVHVALIAHGDMELGLLL